jgi:hypothetical protein
MAGSELTIAGHEFHVRYTARSLKALEERFGSISELTEQLKPLADGKGKILSLTFAVLALGLRHETVDGVPVTEDWLLDNGDFRDLQAYTAAYIAAFAEAFPPAAAAVGINGKVA